MARIHVFAAEAPASLDCAASAAGLRGTQIIGALQAGGHEVSVSIPAEAAPSRDAPGHPLRHDRRSYLDLLHRLRPDVVVWMDPLIRNTPFGAGALHICDLYGLGTPAGELRGTIARHVAGAGLVLTGSAGQDGFWAAALGQPATVSAATASTAVASVIVPYATPPALIVSRQPGASVLRRLHVPGGLHLRPGGLAWLARAAAWCAVRGIGLHIAPPPGGMTDLAAMQALRALETMPGVRLLHAPDLQTVLSGYGPGSLLIDLADDSAERRLVTRSPVVDALTHGVPLLTNCGGDLARRLLRANAAITLPPGAAPEDGVLDAVFDGIAALPAEGLAAMSGAARTYAADWFDASDAQAILLDALDRAAQTGKRRAGRHPGPSAPPPQVLVLTEYESYMRRLRVDLPLGALHQAGGIGGYAVWSKGRLGFSTRSREADPAFDAIWVQRDLPPDLVLALGALNRPYLLDIDDNLLVSPAYRAPLPPAQLQSVRSLVRGCTAITTASDRLAGLLQEYAHTVLVDRAVTCRNLATEQPPWVAAGAPTCVVWASSDTPALTGSYAGIVRAVRDFCLAHGLRLVCIGAPPPGLALEAGVATEHLGLMPYAAYLSHLRALTPAILVAPLDTGADPVTQDFIDGKSDIKVLEALVTGLVGVFSDASAYRDTDLPAPILCRNDYAGWLAGLERARQACLQGGPRRGLPASRIAGGPGLFGWAEALDRVRLRHPMRLSELEQAVALSRTTLLRRVLGPEEFDAEWYMSVNPDVKKAVAAGRITAYGHYSAHGFSEGRPGNPDELAREDGEGFWGNVLNTLSDVRTAVEERAAALDVLQARRRRRQRPGFSGS